MAITWPWPLPLDAWAGLNTSAATGEATQAGYRRLPVTFVATSDGTAIANTASLEWPSAPVDWGTAQAVPVYDAATGGNLLFAHPCAATLIPQYARPRIHAGTLQLFGTAVGFGRYGFGTGGFGTRTAITAVEPTTVVITFVPSDLASTGTWSPPGPFPRLRAA
jgi:hypothetical protein